MAGPRNRARGNRIRSRGGSSRPSGSAQSPRWASQSSCSDFYYNYGSHAGSSGGVSSMLPEGESKLCSVPQEPIHIAVSDQLGDGSSKKSEGTSRGARQRGGKGKNVATGGGFLSIGGMRIYCDEEWISDASSTEVQEVEKDVDVFMLQQGLRPDRIPMKQENDEDSDSDAEDSDSSSMSVGTSTSHQSSTCLSDSSIDHDLAEDYMSNIDQESFRGLLLSKGPLDQVPIECMSHPGTWGSPVQNPRGRRRRKNLFVGESSGQGEQDPTSPFSLKLKDLDVNCGQGTFCEGSSVATPDRGHNKAGVSNVQEWPTCYAKSQKKKGTPGLKKQLRALRIEDLRKERAGKRGFDLCAINVAMENIVKKGVDMHCFQPMEDRERRQVQRLASLYQLKSGSQGGGKKRFVVVTRTMHTCIPDGASRDRLLELIPSLQGPRPNKGTGTRVRSRMKSSRQQDKEMGVSGSSRKRNPQSSKKLMSMPPLSFVSSGVMETTAVAQVDEDKRICTASCSVVVTEAFGSFECHTKGFGSRIMAQMGFVEGRGLGKEGNGIASPIESVRRPKSLGLGAVS